MPRLSQPEVMVTEALNDLENDWVVACADWRDDARRRFEEDFLEPIRPAVRTASGALAELTQLLRQVVRECS